MSALTRPTRGTTPKSSIKAAKIPKARKPTVTRIDKFSAAGLAPLKKTRAHKAKAKRNNVPIIKVRNGAPKRRRKV